MRVRFGIGGLVAAIAVLGIGAVAWACEGVGGSVSPSSARAGDPITYSISGLDNGASYDVSYGGRVVDSGVSGGSSVSGSFPMPDLGDRPQVLFVELTADHSEDTFQWRNSYSVQYVPPAAAATPIPIEAPESSHGVPAKPKAQGADKSHVSAATDEGASETRRSTGAGVAVGGAAPVNPVGSEPKTGGGGTGAGAGAESNQTAESSVPDRVLDAVGSTTTVGPADIPTAGLLFMALVFVAGTGLAAFAIYLLQTGPDPRAAIRSPAPLGPDPVEVELQEMIADEMARKLLIDLELGERPISSG